MNHTCVKSSHGDYLFSVNVIIYISPDKIIVLNSSFTSQTTTRSAFIKIVSLDTVWIVLGQERPVDWGDKAIN
jgi:hypothetical protein